MTGGEPLLRRGVVELVQELARMRTPAGEPLDLALTTNGHLLESLAVPLKAAGTQPGDGEHGRRGRGDL